MAKQLTLLYASSTLDELMPRIEALLALTQGKPGLAREEVEAYLNWSTGPVGSRVQFPKSTRVPGSAFTALPGLTIPNIGLTHL